MLNPHKTTTPVNSLVSVELFEFGSSKRHSVMRSFDATTMKKTIMQLGLLPDFQMVSYVNYLPSKRSFIVSTTTNRHYHLRPIFSHGFSWIYELRRRIGMPHCCARAHATGEGLPDEALRRSHQEAHGIFASSDAIPCQRCFMSYSAHPEVYIERMIADNTINIQAAELKDSNLITYRTIMALLQRRDSFNALLPAAERFLISCGELTQLRQSILRQVNDIKNTATEMMRMTDEGAENDFVGVEGTLPVDLVTNTITRASLSSLEVFGESVEKLDITKSNYTNMFTAQEYVSVFRKQLQAMEFAHVLHREN